jgi:iron complex transport system ATP-binding protein
VSALSWHGVGVTLGARAVLDGVDLAVAPGELVVLAGRNGAGKTTLLRVAAGLVPAARGEVRLLGAPLETLSRRAIAQRLALVPQETAVPFAFSARELVLMGRSPHLGLLGFETRADLAAAEAALERVGVAALADRAVPTLSGGERQLVMVARALAQEAPVLLLDEPTAHLDLAHRLALVALLRELARAGRAVLLVSHDLGAAARAADRVAFLHAGRIAAAGPPAQVLAPALLREVYGVEADVVAHAAGPVVVPRSPAR